MCANHVIHGVYTASTERMRSTVLREDDVICSVFDAHALRTSAKIWIFRSGKKESAEILFGARRRLKTGGKSGK